MTKIAKLVTVILVSRVIVEEDTTDEQAYKLAKGDLIEQAKAHYQDSLHQVMEDFDTPYNKDEE